MTIKERLKIKERLEYLRGELRSEQISYGELAELQSLAEYIEPGDVELLEPAGVPENIEETEIFVHLKIKVKYPSTLELDFDQVCETIADNCDCQIVLNDKTISTG